MNDKTIIPIYRGGNIVTSLGNSFGGSLKETRLTAILGYLISVSPEPFLPLFGIKETPHEINLELSEEEGRSDIHIVTSKDTVIIEAKTSRIDPWRQALRYKASKRILLTNYMHSNKFLGGNIRYISWQHIADLCSTLYKHSDYRVKFLSRDIVNYLKEHNMVKKGEVVEIYAREVNEETTLSLFLHGRIYSCWFEQKSRIPEAGYFAPHFGQNIANSHPGISVGISYVSRILAVDLAASKKEARDVFIKHRGKSWFNKHYDVIQSLLQVKFRTDNPRYILFLGEPRLIFNPSVKKELLQKGSGWLSKRYLTFDELFKAWSGKSIY